MAPLYSTITLFAELIVSGVIFYALWSGWVRNRFPRKLVVAALSYEVLFNISYMVFRTAGDRGGSILPPAVIALAAFHGILSLIMFLTLLAFFITAWKRYRIGINFFKTYPRLTIIFGCFWTLSVLSGSLLYVLTYLH
ncbi:hypothetical protein KGO95_03440 [Patescibacteria group bacterium]|nr:hypothetical protein [Patescibacteria group bacterium]